MDQYVRSLKQRYCSGKMRYRVWLVIFKLAMLKFLETTLAILLLA